MTSPHSQSEDNPNGVAPVPSEQHVPWRSNPTPQEQPTPVQQVPHLPPVGWRPGYRRETQELGYHRLALADPKSRWWKPIASGAIMRSLSLFVGSFLTILLFIICGVLLIGRSKEPADPSEAALDLVVFFLQDPLVFILVLAIGILTWPCFWLARTIMGPKPWGLIHSVAGRMRWGWLTVWGLLAIATLFPARLICNLATTGGRLELSLHVEDTSLPAFLAATVLIVPAYAYTQELVMRGLYMQSIGSWLKHPAFAIVIPVILSGIPLQIYLWEFIGPDSVWSVSCVLAFEIAAGYITWYTGGLEASFALRTAIGWDAALFGLPLIPLEVSYMVTDFFAFLIAISIFTLVVVLLAKQKKIARTRPAQVWVKEQPVPSPAPVR